MGFGAVRQRPAGRKKVTAVPRKEHEQLKQDLAEKEKAPGRVIGVFTGNCKKKSELGVTGSGFR